MLPKEDRKATLLRLYNDDSPLMDHSKDRFLQKNTQNSSSASKDNEAPTEDATNGVDNADNGDANAELLADEPISDDAGDGEENIGITGLDTGGAAGPEGKGVGAEEIFGSSTDAGLDVSGQGGG